MDKIKIGIELEDLWSRGDYREFIMSLVKDDCKYEVHIISSGTTAFVISTGDVLGLPDSQVHIVNFTQDKLDKIDELGIDIYLENLKYVADQIENTTEAYGVYVNELPSKFHAQPKYIVDFEHLVNGLNSNYCEGFKAKED
jgi:hypothetical protein